ncbi:hypothetical protein [Cohnella sp. GbtcB17]|uniref:hypothetical protein n=1 Tax=Cohnella sp. GbtcB17 TaxID=2824762 RepID=UPI001C304BC5|nr:hypothetical protein [Cohnella sp. GbtcB17]
MNDANNGEGSAFETPPLRYRPYQIVHDWGPDPGEKLDRLASLGIGGIVTNVPWDDRYLQNESAFRELAAHMEAVREMGLGIWLYDEKGYPSGSADGLALSDHPELQARGLYRISVRGSGIAPVVVSVPDDGIRFYSASLHSLEEAASGGTGAKCAETAPDGLTVRTEGIEGEWVLHAYVEKYLYEGTHAERNGWSPRRYPNLLDSRAVRRFIETTYEPYAVHIGQGRIGEAVSAFFTDEPSLMAAYQNTEETYARAVVPWTEALPGRFEREHGYALAPCLHALFEGDGVAERTVRVQFYRTVSSLLAESYFRQLADWCRTRGIHFSGHALLEESMVYHTAYYGSLMRVLREMPFPGVDMLTTRPRRYVDDPFGYLLAPKFVSSAARAAGRRDVMAEICPVHFDPSGAFTYDGDASLSDMTGTANLLYMGGVTHINSYYNALEMGEEQYRRYCAHVGRLGVMLEGAAHLPDVGVYYGIETYQADYKPIRQAVRHQSGSMWDRHESLLATARGLLSAGLDFNFLDDRAITDAELKGGALEVGGIAYRVVLMQNVEVIPLAVLEKLQRFEASGGRIVWSGALPASGIYADEHAEVVRRMRACELVPGEEATVRIRAACSESIAQPALRIAGVDGGERLFMSRYRKNGEELLMLLHAGDGMAEAVLDAGAGGVSSAVVYNPETGSRAHVKLPFRLRLKPYGCLFLQTMSEGDRHADD